jgi:hypothetical protein
MPGILHITSCTKSEKAIDEGEYQGDTLATDGFIRGSTSEQSPCHARDSRLGIGDAEGPRVDRGPSFASAVEGV